jgi:hypothetical protein
MDRRLVTVASFDQPPKARLVQNVLEAEGIQVAINDESLVAMDWLLSNAIGGVKVQVWEEDADRAVEILEREFGAEGGGLGPVAIDADVLAAEAEAEEPEDGHREELPQVEGPGPSEAGSPPEAERDACARRMVFVALVALALAPFSLAWFVGLFSFPFAAYAIYLFLNAAFGEGELSSRGRLNLIVGGLFLSPFLIFLSIVLAALLMSVLRG